MIPRERVYILKNGLSPVLFPVHAAVLGEFPFIVVGFYADKHSRCRNLHIAELFISGQSTGLSLPPGTERPYRYKDENDAIVDIHLGYDRYRFVTPP